MKKILFLILGITFSFVLKAQTFRNSEADKIVNGSELVTLDENTHLIKHICFSAPGSKLQKGSNWGTFLKNALSLPSEYGLEAIQSESDDLGSHIKYQFSYKGILIESYIYNLNDIRDKLSANGYYKILKENSKSSKSIISEGEALEMALKYVGARKYRWEEDSTQSKPSGNLYYIEKGDELVLVYKFDIYSADPLSRQYIYVNASNGQIENVIDRIRNYTNSTGTAVTKYHGTKTITTDYYGGTYRLRENQRGSGIETYDLNNGTSYSSAVDFTDTDNYWDTTTNQDNAAYDAHFGAEATYDYYYTKFGRNSIDGSGFALKNYVHFSSGYVNAFWDGSCMTFGDGDGTSYTALTCMDIVGHEITHGLTEHTANLNYSYESGALNESFSDIFGVCIDFYANPTTANYLMGEQINISGIPFRSMVNPNLYSQPDTYLGTYWYTGYGDNGGVHYNSGVQNYWFYLLCVGGSGTNDIGNSFTVNSIGMDNASRIAYRTLTNYLVPTSQYSDARYYSIQAAIDLYGECSPEVINVTNAWYAVGVGASYSNTVIASFTPSRNYFCSLPATVQFTNHSINATSYLWNFGDGTTSTDTNPTHTYSAVGNYTVSLISTGSTYCSSGDTATTPSPIVVSNAGGPVSATCSPTTTNSSGLFGILNFRFNGINNTTAGSSDGYKDYTCNFINTVTEGLSYNYSVTLGTSSSSMVNIWIDLNNNGQFENSTELVLSVNSSLATKTGTINIPHPSVYNTQLRMRVASDSYSTSNLTTACTSSVYGQYEDYTINILQNTNPPVANFGSSLTTVIVGQSITFSDLSLNLPTSWNWEFTGGTPSTSSLKNPTVVYNSTGIYPVKLRVANSNGTDSITKTGYINVVDSYNMCSSNVTTSSGGILYDSGGPTGSYQNSENCSFLINPACGISVTLSFSSFQLESGCDYLTIYDGTSSSGTLLLRASGNTIPSAVTASSGNMYIVFTSDGSVTYSGFQASWTSLLIPNPPHADFGISNINPPFGTAVDFTDRSSDYPSRYEWNFGDGTLSTEKNPRHIYTTAGVKNVSLIVYNCHGSDTLIQPINVQQAPSFRILPATIDVTIPSCDDSTHKAIVLKNSGSGQLVWNCSSSSQTYSDDFDPVIDNSFWGSITGGVETSVNGYLNTPNSLYFNGPLREAITKPLDVSEGGTIDFYLEITNGSGINQTADAGDGVVLSYSVTNGDSWKTISTYIPGSYNTFIRISETIPEEAKSTATLFRWSQPKFNDPDYDNWAIDEIHITLNNNFIAQLSLNSGVVNPGDSVTVNAKLSSRGLLNGTYVETIRFLSNDPLNLAWDLPVSLTVSGLPEITLSDSLLNFGDVFMNGTEIDSLKISNTGCDTLRITGLQCSLAEYSINKNSLKIAPNKSESILVSFKPTSLGIKNGNLILKNIYSDYEIPITGRGIEAPSFELAPDSIILSTNSCQDSVTVPISVYNRGGSDLIIKMKGLRNPKTEILALTYGVDLSREYPNTITAINKYFTNYNLTEINTTISGALQSALVGKDILLIAEQELGSGTVFTGFASVIQRFVSEGGTVIFCGTDNTNCIYNTGIFAGSFGNITMSGQLNVVNSSHPLADQVPSSFTGSNATFSQNFTNPGIEQVVKYSNSDVVATRKLGMGKAIYIGFDFYLYSNEAARLIANAVQWGSSSTTGYLSSSIQSDTIAPGDSSLILLKFNSTDLLSGIYSDSIKVNSNDPLFPSRNIHYQFTLNGSPVVSLSDSCLSYGNVYLGQSKRDTLKIRNTGCDTLIVNNIINVSEKFHSERRTFKVAPQDTGLVVITFSPTQLGEITDSLFIFSNGIDTSIILKGRGTLPPRIELNQETLIASISQCNDSSTVPLIISNKGGDDLNFTFITYSEISDDFDSVIDNSIWQTITGGVAANSCGYHSAPNSLYFNNGYTREAIMKPINTFCGDSISFYLKISNESNPCETADPGEDVILSYSVNGGINWVTIRTYLTGNYNTFTLIKEKIPLEAKTNATLFRWSQPSNSGTSFDNWSIDDVKISFLGNERYSASPQSGTCSPGDSAFVDMTFYSDGLKSGIFSDSIIIKSNDINSPMKSLPFELRIDGSPEIVVEDSIIWFGNVYQGSVNNISFTLLNSGCDTLHVNNIISSLPEFTVNKKAFSILPFDSTSILVTFSPLLEKNYSGHISILNDDSDINVNLYGNGIGTPILSIDPDSLYSLVLLGDSVNKQITISNPGKSDLTFSFPDFIDKYPTVSEETKIIPYMEIEKGMEDSRAGNLVVNNFGGPDTFGYKWKDSDEDGGPNFNWVDISSTGTLVTGLGDDNYVGSFPIGFNFPFYENSYNQFYIQSNGLIFFENPNASLSNQPIPNSASPNNFIAWCWDDLCSRGTVYYEELGNQLVIQFNNYGEYGTSGTSITAQVILFNDGKIKVQYLNTVGAFDTQGCTIGIENKSGIDGLQVAFNTSFIHNNLALLFSRTPEWLTISPLSGTIPPGGSEQVNLKMNSKGLNIGSYADNLTITSNDLGKPEIKYPVSMEVFSYPNIALSVSTIDFGSVTLGRTFNKKVKVYNTGFDTLFVSGQTTNNPLFYVSNSPYYVVPGDSQLVSVQFSPTNTGEATGLMNITSNDPDSPRMAITLNGVGVESPPISLSQDTVYLKYSAGSYDYISLFSNMSWTISSNQSWLTVTPQSGNRDHLIIFTATENTLSASRTAIVTILLSNGMSETVRVIQASSNSNVVIARRIQPIVIDGCREDSWDIADQIPISRPFKTERPTVTATWSSLYDDNGLYVMVEVDDDDHWPGWKSGGNSWEYDKPEVYWDVNEELKDGSGAGINNSGHYMLADGFLESSYDTEISKNPLGNHPGGSYCYSLIGEGYVYEHFVPFANLKDINGVAIDSTTKRAIGFDVTIVDQDEGITTSRQRCVWSNDGNGNNGSSDESWNNMDGAGTITLGNYIPQIPLNTEITNISYNKNVCSNAISTITLAGGGTFVSFQSGSSVDLIAGNTIKFLPGFHAYDGSYAHAWITKNGTFCDGGSGSIVMDPSSEKSIDSDRGMPIKEQDSGNGKSIKVYPNPNNGKFVLEFSNVEYGATIRIYNLLGTLIYHSTANNQTSYEIKLPEIRRGIYIIKVSDGKEQFTRKMVVN
jgi:Zn-dependent metalloprotease